MKKNRITAFLGVFEGKLDKLRKQIKKELDKPKKERNKHFLKKVLGEAKEIRALVSEMKDENTIEVKCPHCDKKFEI